MTKRMIDADALLEWLNEQHDRVLCCSRALINMQKEKTTN